jgi:hypothetical protein
MSCYCDGNDPGCETCHPDMLPEARGDMRALQLAQLNLLGVAARDARSDADVLRAADDYQKLAERANEWNALGTERKP